ncbi:MAG: hypothetical protein ACD_39C00909G0003 [uncultured bacterium]|nr:MAG: hypothetical protein ACD_39C00909G0003 [uncultured bacterium]
MSQIKPEIAVEEPKNRWLGIMRPDFEPRIGVGLALLEFAISTDSSKVCVVYKRNFDYFLRLIFYPVLATPFMLLAVGMINPIIKGPWKTGLVLGALFLLLMTGVVAMLSEFFMLARDGFRRICFDVAGGRITVDQGGFDYLLSRHVALCFADVAGFRLNHFAYRSGFRHLSGFEVAMVMQNGSAQVIFPLISNYEQALENANRLKEATGLPIISCR